MLHVRLLSASLRCLVLLEGKLMIITKTPFRMSFFGGGTDIPAFFNENGGAVLSTTFDKYCYVNVRHLPRFLIIQRSCLTSSIEARNGSE